MFGRSPPPLPPPVLQPYALLGGLDAAQLWPLTNLVLPAWLLLCILPTWRHTPLLTLVPPFIHAAMYAAMVISLPLNAPPNAPGPDFGSLHGVVAMFQDPSVVFLGWVHYLAFDLLVGRAIVQDAVTRASWSPAIHALVVVPCLILTLMLGPTGFLLYSCIAGSGLFGGKGPGNAPPTKDDNLELRWQRLKDGKSA